MNYQSKFITGGPRPPFRFRFANRDGAKFEVVGIVANARHHEVAEAPVPTVYFPSALTQRYELAARPRSLVYWLSLGIAGLGYAILLWALYGVVARLLVYRKRELALRLCLGAGVLRALHEEGRRISASLLFAAFIGAAGSAALFAKGYAWNSLTVDSFVASLLFSVSLACLPLLLSAGMACLKLLRADLRQSIS